MHDDASTCRRVFLRGSCAWDTNVTDRGIGLAAAVHSDVTLATAQAAERKHFHSFWLNNPPGGNAISQLVVLSTRVPAILLGVGVIPLSHSTPGEIASSVHESRMPTSRLYLGIGSGSASGGLQRVREGVDELHRLVDCDVVVAALGPKMCTVAGEVADGVLLNWLTPDAAQRSLAWIRDGADRAQRSMPRVMAYVRVAIEGEGSDRFAHEAATYGSYPQYAAHFERMGIRAEDTGIVGTSVAIHDALTQWDDIVDEVVLRVITATDTTDEIARVVDAVAP